MTTRGGSVRVEGMARLRKTLKAAEDNLRDLKALHRQVSGVVAARGKSTGPKRTGALRASVRPSAATGKVQVLAGTAAVPYAGPIHWGWAKRNIRPNPWVRDAAVATQPTWVPMYESGVQREMDKVRGA